MVAEVPKTNYNLYTYGRNTMLSNNVDPNKRYEATYEFVHFVATKQNCMIQDRTKRAVFTVEKCYSGYPQDIVLAVKYYMGHYGAIQGKLLGFGKN